MNCIQNSFNHFSFNKIVPGLVGALAITGIAIATIGLTKLSGPFNVITQMGRTNQGILLGASFFTLALDTILICHFLKKNKIPLKKEKIHQPDFFNKIPSELILKIFSYANIEELVHFKLVSKKWKSLASNKNLWNAFDLKKAFPPLVVINEKDWEIHRDLSTLKLQVEKADQSILIPTLKKALAFSKGAVITYVTIPKDLTFNKLYHLSCVQKDQNVIDTKKIGILYQGCWEILQSIKRIDW